MRLKLVVCAVARSGWLVPPLKGAATERRTIPGDRWSKTAEWCLPSHASHFVAPSGYGADTGDYSMLTTILIALSFTWPTECQVAGDLYFEAAAIRDGGISLNDATSRLRSKAARDAIAHVFARPDMTPEQWRYFAVGACVGAMEYESRRAKPMFKPRPINS